MQGVCFFCFVELVLLYCHWHTIPIRAVNFGFYLHLIPNTVNQDLTNLRRVYMPRSRATFNRNFKPVLTILVSRGVCSVAATHYAQLLIHPVNMNKNSLV